MRSCVRACEHAHVCVFYSFARGRRGGALAGQLPLKDLQAPYHAWRDQGRVHAILVFIVYCLQSNEQYPLFIAEYSLFSGS